ncbi:MAG: iron-containing alcohol dehydrogenase [Myxococcales bacterium]
MEGVIAEMSFPTRIVLGAGAVSRLGDWCRRLGMQKPLVVTDQGVVRAGLAERISIELRKAGLQFGVFDRVEPNPTDKDAHDGLAAYREQGCDGIIALGGGSPLDAAKLVRLLTSHEGPIARYDDVVDGGRFVTNPMPPLVAIPTTAGTGSEVSRSAVALLKETGRKTVIFAPPLMPSVALCDPELTYGLPPQPTAWTGMDAFTHNVEAFCAKGFHPLADAFAIDGVARVARSLVKAVQQPRDLQARTDMMIAAMQGAAAFQKGLGACHALAHAIGAYAPVNHGLTNAICLPAVMEFNRAAVPGRLAKIAVAMGERPDLGEETLARRAVERTRELNKACGIPAGLREVGLREEQLEEISHKAFADASHPSNPRACTREDLLAMLRASFEAPGPERSGPAPAFRRGSPGRPLSGARVPSHPVKQVLSADPRPQDPSKVKAKLLLTCGCTVTHELSADRVIDAPSGPHVAGKYRCPLGHGPGTQG